MYLPKVLSIVFALVASLSRSNGAPSTSLNVVRRSIASDPHIVGGAYIEINKAPYQISIESFGWHFCGGAIIGVKWALTSAYCAKTAGSSWTRIRIRAGSSRVVPVVEWQGTTHRLERKIIHPSYDAQAIDYDVALLEISDNFLPSATTAPVSLPPIGTTEDRFIDYEQKAFATGWGISQIAGHFQTWNLRGVEIPIIPRVKCGRKFENKGVKVTSRMICVAGNGEGPCSGDEGGPLVHKETLIGLFSWNVGKCDNREFPSVYTNLFDEEIRSFIMTHTNL